MRTSLRRRVGAAAVACLLLGPVLAVIAEAAQARPGQGAPPRAPGRRATRPAPRVVSDEDYWTAAARAAWAYVPAHTVASTGLVNATSAYAYATAWDIGSMLAAIHCARELELIQEAEYRRRIGNLLSTLERLPLFEGIAFNKSYSVRGTVPTRGPTNPHNHGWSSIDLGRLLVWLRIVGRDPEFGPATERVVGRLDRARLARDGYLRGGERTPEGAVEEHQEGTLGYEQYAARGFEAWQMPVGNALDLRRHAVPIRLMGHELLADDRGNDRLTSEPFVLLGLEIGWTEDEKTLAEAVLSIQQERWRRTGQVTMVSEDAVAQPPHYFYYYCVFAQGRLFHSAAQDWDTPRQGPRWVSTKAAFGWAALRDDDYTRRAVRAVAPARTARGWASGIYEGRARSVGAVNINTQAVILEAALVRKRGGRPLLERP